MGDDFLTECKSGNLENVKRLSSLPETDLLARDSYRRNGLLLASLYGHYEVVKLLLSLPGIDKKAVAKFGKAIYVLNVITLCIGCNSLHLAVLSDKADPRIVRVLLDTNLFDINSQNCYGDTPILYASQKNHVEIARMLLETPDINVNIPDFDGVTPFLVAVMHGNLEVVNLLISDERTNVNYKTFDGKCALHLAAAGPNVQVLHLLLNLKAINVYKRDAKGNSIAHLACSAGNLEAIKAIISDDRVPFNGVNDEGETPFICLCRTNVSSRMTIVAFMISLGLHFPSVRDLQGKTVIHFACETGDTALVDILMSESEARSLVFNTLATQLEDARRKNLEYEQMLVQSTMVNQSLEVKLQEKKKELDYFVRLFQGFFRGRT